MTKKMITVEYDGKDIIQMGIRQGPFVKECIEVANSMAVKGMSRQEIQTALLKREEPLILPMSNQAPMNDFLNVSNDIELTNKEGVLAAMDAIRVVPTVIRTAIMPDACPAGTIPVGAVVTTKNALHPSYHSADVCCSMALTELSQDIPQKDLLDVIQEFTHFGSRPMEVESRRISLEDSFIEDFDSNQFLQHLGSKAQRDFGSQGDGNHFYYVGRRRSNGRVCIVSHHGSRGFGASVYNNGKRVAEKLLARRARGIDKEHAWLDFDSAEGKEYWEALCVVREWTKRNHFDLHNAIATHCGVTITDQFWNPHNFIFKEGDEFHHAKGATPSYKGHSDDDSGHTLIPMNMEEPILITSHSNNKEALGFAPHGAGRDMSRTAYSKSDADKTPPKIDYRFWSGYPDESEFPNAYKSAARVTEAIQFYGLANIVDYVDPYGSIMAGDVEYMAHWRVKKREKEAANG